MSGTTRDMKSPDGDVSDVLLDYLLGDLTPEEVRHLERRLEDDSILRVELYERQRFLEAMHRLPAAQPRAGFTASVMASVHSGRSPMDEMSAQPSSRPHAVIRRHFFSAAIAALLAAMAFTGWMFLGRSDQILAPVVAQNREVIPPSAPPVVVAPVIAMATAEPDYAPASSPAPIMIEPAKSPNPALQAAIDQLRSSQLPDGSWDPESSGGTWNARPGLTALVVCSLMQANGELSFTGRDAVTTTRALDYLIEVSMAPMAQRRTSVVREQQISFIIVALSEARRLCRDEAMLDRINQALSALRAPAAPDEFRIASSILPHLPKEAELRGGQVYQIARSILLESSS